MAIHDAYLVFSHKKTLRLQIDTKSQINRPTITTPVFMNPIRRIYFPPHHSSHQANPLQQRQQTSLPNSDVSCTRCNSIPVPTPLPSHHLTPRYTHLRPTTPIIPFYGSIFCVLLRYYTICFMFHLT